MIQRSRRLLFDKRDVADYRLCIGGGFSGRSYSQSRLLAQLARGCQPLCERRDIEAKEFLRVAGSRRAVIVSDCVKEVDRADKICASSFGRGSRRQLEIDVVKHTRVQHGFEVFDDEIEVPAWLESFDLVGKRS